MLNFQPSSSFFPTTTISNMSMSNSPRMRLAMPPLPMPPTWLVILLVPHLPSQHCPPTSLKRRQRQCADTAVCTSLRLPWVLLTTPHPRVLLNFHGCSMSPVLMVNVADTATPLRYRTRVMPHPLSSTCVNAVSGPFTVLWRSTHFGMSYACHLGWQLLTSSNRREGSTINVITISLPCSMTWQALRYELPTPFLLFTANHLVFQ